MISASSGSLGLVGYGLCYLYWLTKTSTSRSIFNSPSLDFWAGAGDALKYPQKRKLLQYPSLW